MEIEYLIKRYSSYETRIVGIDVDDIVKREIKEMISSLAGFEEDAIDTIEINFASTISKMVKDYL